MNHLIKNPLWIFDLDNTLHNASDGVFPHINQEMTAFIMRRLNLNQHDAFKLREHYWHQYGATLKGLALHHNIPPQTFLNETHPIPSLLKLLIKERPILNTLKQLKGQKIILSNGPVHYVSSVVKHLNMAHYFDELFGAECMDFHSKPNILAFRTVLKKINKPIQQCIMIEDSVLNLKTAKQLGMKTIWLSHSLKKPPYVDFKIRHIRELLTLPI